MKRICLTAAVSLWLAVVAGGAEPAATYRGNSRRTGCDDGRPGPAAPKVLWHWQAKEHFIAAPVVRGDRLYVSGLGAFNVATFFALDTQPGTAKRVVWTKTAPYLKLPTVSSPAVLGDRLIFGDGMHQTNDATLHCLGGDGRPLWQLPVPGTLVHLEGSPSVAGGKVFLGGGAAGVLCVDPDRVLLDGKEMEPEAIRKILDAKWKELQDRYAVEKKKDEFAVPPSEDQLPRATPLRVWEQGKDKWHVDAPVNVAGDRVLVASAYLDKEKAGDRALFCLDARTGGVLWRTALPYNPWGGPSLADDLVVLAGSTIGYDPKALKGAKGFIAAYGLADGKERWRKDVPAGIVSCVALAKDLAVATATDGKVRAFDLATGERRWTYDAKTPFFAPPAVAGELVYAGDLKGVLHAIDLATGGGRWKLDLAAEPVKAAGMIYGGPVVHGGRLYVATCNLEGAAAGRPTAVVCVGDK